MISLATVDTLGALTALAERFYASSEFLRDFDAATFCNTWREILTAGIGVIIVMSNETGPTGAIGGICHTDPNNGRMTASEMFWFVAPESRGSGVTLYRAFEEWARLKGCVDIRMVHLSDSMPLKLKTFYEAIGFKEVETHYVKEIK